MSTRIFGIFVLSFGLLFAFAPSAYAAPATISFSASPSSISNDYDTALSWSASEATSGSITFSSCSDGITIEDEVGNTLSCYTPNAVSGASGTASFKFLNISGTSKTVVATFTPNNTDGSAYPSGAMSTTISITTAPQTIIDFTTSSSTINSGDSVTLYWTTVYVPGVNLIFDCNPNLVVYTASNTQAPCGVAAYPDILVTSNPGWPIHKVVNIGSGDTTLTVRVIPAIDTVSFNALQNKELTIRVLPPQAAPTPSVTSFTASTTQVASGGAITLTWDTKNTEGANLQFTCGYDLKVSSSAPSATTTPVYLPCNTPAYSPVLPATGSVTVYLTNTNTYPQVLNISLLPQNSSGIYLGTLAKTISVSVLHPGAAVQKPTTPVVPNTASSSTGTVVSTAPSLRTPITIGLGRNSKNSQVSLLQTFLAQNSTIYPQGLVTGFFGAATEAAVKAFQVKHGLAKAGDSGYGYVGPKTRAKINSLSTP